MDTQSVVSLAGKVGVPRSHPARGDGGARKRAGSCLQTRRRSSELITPRPADNRPSLDLRLVREQCFCHNPPILQTGALNRALEDSVGGLAEPSGHVLSAESRFCQQNKDKTKTNKDIQRLTCTTSSDADWNES
jgi:hypothetical protein